MEDEPKQAGARAERSEKEQAAWEVYEAVVDQEAKHMESMRGPQKELEEIRRRKSAAQAMLAQAMNVRNRLDMGQDDAPDQTRFLETPPKVEHHLLGLRRIEGGGPPIPFDLSDGDPD